MELNAEASARYRKGTEKMKHEYRLVKVAKSDGPNAQTDPNRLGGGHLPGERQDREVWIEQPTRQSHPGRWIAGIAAVLLIVVMAVWMTHVSGAIHQLNQTTAANSHMLQQQSTQLSGIRASLNFISQQITHLQNQIQYDFSLAMSYFTHH